MPAAALYTLSRLLQCCAGDSKGGVHLWDLRQRRPVRCFQHSPPLESERLQLCFSAKHSSLVLAGGSSFRVEDLRMPGVRPGKLQPEQVQCHATGLFC